MKNTEMNKISKISIYMRSKYLNPYNLTVLPIIKEFNKLLRGNKIKTIKNIDSYFKRIWINLKPKRINQLHH